MSEPQIECVTDLYEKHMELFIEIFMTV